MKHAQHTRNTGKHAKTPIATKTQKLIQSRTMQQWGNKSNILNNVEQQIMKKMLMPEKADKVQYRAL